MFDALKNIFWKHWLRKRKIKLADSFKNIPAGSTLYAEDYVSIGKSVMRFRSLHVGAMTYIRSSSELLNVSNIGRYCSIGNNVILGQERSLHPLDWVSTHPFQYTNTALRYQPLVEPAVIGHDVWIGRDALIMEGVCVGNGAVIAARSVVTKDVPAYAIVAGAPARVVGYRHTTEIINGLIASNWWDLPLELIKSLPLDAPEQFLTELSRRNEKATSNHISVAITRRGCRTI